MPEDICLDGLWKELSPERKRAFREVVSAMPRDQRNRGANMLLFLMWGYETGRIEPGTRFPKDVMFQSVIASPI
jgi:hypothetical protein